MTPLEEQRLTAPIPPGKAGKGARRRRYSMLAAWYGKERAAGEIAAHTAQPEKFDSLLDRVLEEISGRDKEMLVRLRRDWPRIIGGTFSRFCEPAVLREGVLTLKVRHSALLVELKPSCDLIRQKVNSVIGEEVCREIRLRV